jgi:hypothetical protein
VFVGAAIVLCLWKGAFVCLFGRGAFVLCLCECTVYFVSLKSSVCFVFKEQRLFCVFVSAAFVLCL